MLRKIEAVRFGIAEPKDLEKIAVEAIAKFGLEDLSDETAELVHDCIDFAENPTISDLNEIEKRAREILKAKLS